MARTFTQAHRVDPADVTPEGRAHPHAIARYLQETAFADGLDAGIGAESFWIIRRLTLTVRNPPTFPELLELRTWCSGKAKSLAERSTAISGDGGADVEARAIWVHVDPQTRRPTRLPPLFEEVFGPSAGERRARGAFRHPPGPPPEAEQLPWRFGRADLDLAGHVSNLWYWRVAEQYLELGDGSGPSVLEAEFRAGMGAGEAVVHRAGSMLWVCAGSGEVAATLSAGAVPPAPQS